MRVAPPWQKSALRPREQPQPEEAYGFFCPARCGTKLWAPERPIPKGHAWPLYWCFKCAKKLRVGRATCVRCLAELRTCRCGRGGSSSDQPRQPDVLSLLTR
eukprot:2053795-Alexandrium_andersonii.AAC.1